MTQIQLSCLESTNESRSGSGRLKKPNHSTIISSCTWQQLQCFESTPAAYLFGLLPPQWSPSSGLYFGQSYRWMNDEIAEIISSPPSSTLLWWLLSSAFHPPGLKTRPGFLIGEWAALSVSVFWKCVTALYVEIGGRESMLEPESFLFGWEIFARIIITERGANVRFWTPNVQFIVRPIQVGGLKSLENVANWQSEFSYN